MSNHAQDLLDAAKLIAEQNPEQYLGKSGVQGVFDNARGFQLASYYWPATTSTVRGILQMIHGSGSYLCFEFLKPQGPGLPPTYAGSWIEALNAAGFSVTGIDNQGCGRSQGLQGYIERMDNFVDDIADFAKSYSTGDALGFATGTPRFLLGESLGGCVATLVAMREPELFAGVVLLAPMLSLETVSKRGLNPYLRPIAGWISWLAPTLPVASTNRNTVYPDLQRAYDLDPYTYKGKTRARNACEYLQATEDLSRCLDQVVFPFIAFHSEGDTQVDVVGSKRLYAQAKSEVKTLRLLDMWHSLVKEPGNDLILAEVIQWLGARLA